MKTKVDSKDYCGLWGTPTALDMIEWFSIFVACTSYVSNECAIFSWRTMNETNKIRRVFLKHVHILPQF